MDSSITRLSQTDKSTLDRETISLLRNIYNNLKELDSSTKRYIPDYAAKYNKPYTLMEICKLYELVGKLHSDINVWLGVPPRTRGLLNHDENPINVIIQDWIEYNKYMSKDELVLLYSYDERINTFKHYLATVSNIDIDINNTIVTIFRSSGYSAMHRVISILEITMEKIKTALKDRDGDDEDCNDCCSRK